jgi:hypothetical protein
MIIGKEFQRSITSIINLFEEFKKDPLLKDLLLINTLRGLITCLIKIRDSKTITKSILPELKELKKNAAQINDILFTDQQKEYLRVIKAILDVFCGINYAENIQDDGFLKEIEIIIESYNTTDSTSHDGTLEGNIVKSNVKNGSSSHIVVDNQPSQSTEVLKTNEQNMSASFLLDVLEFFSAPLFVTGIVMCVLAIAIFSLTSSLFILGAVCTGLGVIGVGVQFFNNKSSTSTDSDSPTNLSKVYNQTV